MLTNQTAAQGKPSEAAGTSSGEIVDPSDIDIRSKGPVKTGALLFWYLFAGLFFVHADGNRFLFRP